MREKHLFSRYKVLCKSIKNLTSLLVGEVALQSSAGEGYQYNGVAVLLNLGIGNTEVPVPPHDLSHKRRGKEPYILVFFFSLWGIFVEISFFLAIPPATFATTPPTPPSSLFFKEEEISHIQEDKHDVLRCEEIKLFAILYTNDQHWSLWINDKVIRPENRHDLGEVCIKKVTPDEVTFSYTSSKDADVKTFTLRPHSVKGILSENET